MGEAWSIERIRPEDIRRGDRSPGGHYVVVGDPVSVNDGKEIAVAVEWSDGGLSTRTWSADDTVTVDRRVQ